MVDAQILTFITVVGVGSTIALDLWGILTAQIGWMPGTHWPSVGRWLVGLATGKLIFDGSETRPFTAFESALGWIFHYAVGLFYAAMFPIFWGVGFIEAPVPFPFILIGVIISTLAGLMILMPGMGGGVFARRVPNTAGMIIYVIIAHIVFAIAQYLLALAVA